MASFSHSKIGAYENCKLQYKFQYIDRIVVKAKDTIETYLGTRVHEALEKLYKDLRYEKILPLEELLGFYNQQWKRNWENTIIITKKEYTQDNYHKMGEKYLRDYYNRHKPFDQGRIIGLETKSFLPLDEEGKYNFHVRIDRLMDMGDGLYEVHDYKTGMELLSQELLDQDRQLAMYSLWVRDRFKDFKQVRLVWHFLAFDKEMDSYRTGMQLENLKKEIMAKIEEIELTQEFPATVTSLCGWCLYKEVCPMWKHEVQLDGMPSNEYLNDPGVKLVDEYVKIKKDIDEKRKEAEEKLEKLKKAIIDFSKKEEVSVVFGTENKVTVSEYESIKFPGKNAEERKGLIKLLQNLGKLEEVSDLDVHALSRVLRNNEWDEKELAALREFGSREKSCLLSISRK